MFIKKTYIFLLFSYAIIAQSGFGDSNLIAEDFLPTQVVAADIDNDGDNDIIVSGWTTNTIAWYENLDGLGNFGTINYITQNLTFVQSLSAADIDGDGDNDIIATSPQNNKVMWYENLDGLGNFNNGHLITDAVLTPRKVMAADIDNDNDLDIVLAISDYGKVVWYENLDGLGSFNTEHIITSTATGVYELDIADVDNDGALDVLTNSSTSGYPSWFKNTDGAGNFSTENMIDFIGTFQVKAADIDGDGDVDLFKLESISGDVVIHWLENTDGLGTFEQRQLITNDYHGSDMFPTDVDNDGDIDLVVGFAGDGVVAWFENENGQGAFGDIKIIVSLPSISVVSANIDNDTYKDVITIQSNSKVVWYKNETYLGLSDYLQEQIVLYPNPVTSVLEISSSVPIQSLVFYTILGKKVKLQRTDFKTIDLSTLSSGVYFLHLRTAEGRLVKKIIKN